MQTVTCAKYHCKLSESACRSRQEHSELGQYCVGCDLDRGVRKPSAMARNWERAGAATTRLRKGKRKGEW